MGVGGCGISPIWLLVRSLHLSLKWCSSLEHPPSPHKRWQLGCPPPPPQFSFADIEWREGEVVVWERGRGSGGGGCRSASSGNEGPSDLLLKLLSSLVEGKRGCGITPGTHVYTHTHIHTRRASVALVGMDEGGRGLTSRSFIYFARWLVWVFVCYGGFMALLFSCVLFCLFCFPFLLRCFLLPVSVWFWFFFCFFLSVVFLSSSLAAGRQSQFSFSFSFFVYCLVHSNKWNTSHPLLSNKERERERGGGDERARRGGRHTAIRVQRAGLEGGRGSSIGHRNRWKLFCHASTQTTRLRVRVLLHVSRDLFMYLFGQYFFLWN